ncbi:hypothetical protein K7432_000627 [Basidiobolus ranarum]|uniref:PH domain-containing protein n=1 Tax=Basidiobolus ranarum TaxID=34480 RepID=A0ABR2WAY7_9FUNG
MATAVESATQISLPVEKEDVPEVSVPVSSETVEAPETEATIESQATPEEPAVEAEAAQEEPSAPVEAAEEPAVVEEVSTIQHGYLQKRGLKPLRLWKNRYFGFRSEPFALAQLRLVSKKSLKATSAPKEEFERVNKSLFHNIATATVSGEGLMFYFKSNNPDHVEVPLGVINLEDVQSVATAKASKPHAFCVKTNARDYILAAPSSDEAKQWVHTIQQKLDSLATLSNVTETSQYKEAYERLVTRQAFNSKSASTIPTGILSDSEVLSGSDNEKENEPTPVAAAAPETEAVEASAEPEVSVVEESAVVSENVEEAPKRRSVFGGLKSLIKKSEKTSDSSIEVVPVAEESAESKEVVEAQAEVVPETPVEDVPAEQVEEVANAEEAAEVVEVKAEEPEAEHKPSRPMSFGIPKFFKSHKKDEESAEATEAPVEAEALVDVTAVEASEPVETEAVVEAAVAEVESPEVVAETTEEVEAPAEAATQAVSTENVAEAPGSPIKRTLSNMFRSKKSKNSESHVAAVEEATEAVNAEEPVAVEAVETPEQVAPEVAEVESTSVPEAQPEPVAEATTEEAVEQVAATEEPVAAEQTAEPTADSENVEAAEHADTNEDKAKKPTLFKRMTFMLRSNTGSKSSSSTTEVASSSTSPEVITEAPEEVAEVEQKVEATEEPVKSH